MDIVTRGDFDGLVSSVLLTEVEDIRKIRFVHPKDVQDGLVGLLFGRTLVRLLDRRMVEAEHAVMVGVCQLMHDDPRLVVGLLQREKPVRPRA